MGHSSLAYLIGLKVDRLKIDRSFVKDVARSETNQKLISAMISLGQSLSLDIVVEGVETPEDAAILARLGCSTAQGYLFARPMPANALDTWITDHQPTALKRKTRSKHLSVA
ncbi:MAG: EAL domain-containing protein [Rhizobium sp.]|nr:EAL domain-containing protein [Rhizobium sp.]